MLQRSGCKGPHDFHYERPARERFEKDCARVTPLGFSTAFLVVIGGDENNGWSVFRSDPIEQFETRHAWKLYIEHHAGGVVRRARVEHGLGRSEHLGLEARRGQHSFQRVGHSVVVIDYYDRPIARGHWGISVGRRTTVACGARAVRVPITIVIARATTRN